MKCLQCGEKDFAPIQLFMSTVLATSGSVRQTVNAYACQNCGRIELYAPEFDGYAQKIAEEKKLKELEEKERREKNKRDILDRIKVLETIVASEDSTVRQIREAQEEIEQKKKELYSLEGQISYSISEYTPRRR